MKHINRSFFATFSFLSTVSGCREITALSTVPPDSGIASVASVAAADAYPIEYGSIPAIGLHVGQSVRIHSRTVESRDRVPNWQVSESGGFSVERERAQLLLKAIATGSTLISLSAGRDLPLHVYAFAENEVLAADLLGVSDTLLVGDRIKPLMRLTHANGTKIVVGATEFVSSTASVVKVEGQAAVASSVGHSTLSAISVGQRVSRTVTVVSHPTAIAVTSIPEKMLVGERYSITATGVSVEGVSVPCRIGEWRVEGAGVSTVVSGETVTVAPQAAGSIGLQFRCDENLSYVKSVEVLGVPSGARGYALRVVPLFDGPSSDSITVSGALPLVPGMLPSGQTDLAITYQGRLVPTYSRVLQGRHADGSARSVFLQFKLPKQALLDTFRLNLGESGVRRSVISNPAVEGLMPTYVDTKLLLASNVVGPIGQASLPVELLEEIRYDQDFSKYETLLWSDSKAPAAMNYYDRILAYFAMWVRTQEPRYLKRGLVLARRFRDEYVIPNSYGLPEWQAGIDGLAVSYFFSGDEATRDAVLHVATYLQWTRGITTFITNLQSASLDNRIMARVLMSKVLAVRLGATSLPQTDRWYAAIPDIRATARENVRDIISTQRSDGSWRFKSQCDQSSNFMTALLLSAMASYYDEVDKSPAILNSFTKGLNFLHTQWRSNERLFQYYSGYCAGHGDAVPATDLNGLFLDPVGWYYRQTGDLVIKQWGDEIFRGSVSRAYLAGDKQFNQQYQTSWRWLGYRSTSN